MIYILMKAEKYVITLYYENIAKFEKHTTFNRSLSL